MKVLVTGGTGLVGVPFVQRAVERGHDVHVGQHHVQPHMGKPIDMNLLDGESMRKAFVKGSPDVVVHLAALTDVDSCERDRELAHRINSVATGMIAELAYAHDAFLLYVSTDYVFDGERGLYSPEDTPNPINWYGVTKLKGEELVGRRARDWSIARTSTPFGLHKSRTSFPLFIAEKLLRGEEAKVVKDQYTSPTYTENLADMLLEISERRLPGVIHVAGATRASRLQLAVESARRLGLNQGLIKPVEMRSLNWAAKRPKDSSLDVSRALSMLETKPLSLEESLEELFCKLRLEFDPR